MNSQQKNRKRTLYIPNAIPPEDWCDFRHDYENGMTLKDIAQKYYCDPRTVRQCIVKNKSSAQLGRKSTPPVTLHYEHSIRSLAKYFLETNPESFSSLYKLSCQITQHLKESGYSGSERTIRNYLNTLPSIKAHYEQNLESKEKTKC